MFEKIRIGLKNFAHNLLNLIQHLFIGALLAGGIILCAFYAAPFLPVLFYGVVTAVVSCILFNAAHKVIDFLSNMFTGPNADVTAEPIFMGDVVVEPIHSSTQKVNDTLASHTVKRELVDAYTQTNNAPSNILPLKAAFPDVNETVDNSLPATRAARR